MIKVLTILIVIASVLCVVRALMDRAKLKKQIESIRREREELAESRAAFPESERRQAAFIEDDPGSDTEIVELDGKRFLMPKEEKD